MTLSYVGILVDGLVFDRSGPGKLFIFKLRKNEVVKGLEEGLLGMRVGGRRRLLIPPELGYGNKKIQGIPPNSILYFEIELIKVG